jgi:hypothetical protein
VNLVIAILALMLLAVVILVVSAPLRSVRRRGDPASGEPDELQAAREAKYREIRDAELDYRTGKLSREDYLAVDATLRAEAVEILRRIDDVAAEEVGEAVKAKAGQGPSKPKQPKAGGIGDADARGD